MRLVTHVVLNKLLVLLHLGSAKDCNNFIDRASGINDGVAPKMYASH